MPEAFIVDAVRTPVGKRGGGLSAVHPADLGAHSIKALMDRTGVDPSAVEDVIFGNPGPENLVAKQFVMLSKNFDEVYAKEIATQEQHFARGGSEAMRGANDRSLKADARRDESASASR